MVGVFYYQVMIHTCRVLISYPRYCCIMDASFEVFLVVIKLHVYFIYVLHIHIVYIYIHIANYIYILKYAHTFWVQGMLACSSADNAAG